MLAALVQMGVGSVDPMDHVYFWVGALIALPPAAVFGTIGFLLIRAYLRDRARAAAVAAAPIGALRD
jgi:hypothetical protein